MRPKAKSPAPSGFLNVDLEITGGAGRDVLVDELALVLLRMNRPNGKAGFETLAMTRKLNATLRALVSTIEKLSPKARRAWRSARRREFNIGIQAGAEVEELPIDQKTVERIAKLGGRIAITVYPSRGNSR